MKNPSLPVTSKFGEHEQLKDTLQKAKGEEEQCGCERTAALAKANAELQAEVARHKRTEKALQESGEHLRNILNSLPSFIGLLTPEGRLAEVNQAALDMASLSAETEGGKPFEETYWWSYSPAVQAQLRAAIQQAAQGEMVRYDVPMRVGEHQFLVVDFTLTPLRNAEGQVTHLVPSAVAIPERKPADERRQKAYHDGELQRQTRAAEFTHDDARLQSAQGIALPALSAQENVCLPEHAERVKQFREDVLDTMSHELRTPLHVITGYVQLFLEGSFGAPTSEQTEVLQRVERSARDLLGLITGLLDMQCLDAGLLAAEVNEVQVTDLMADLQHKLATEWTKPTLRVTWQLAPDLPRLYTDYIKLKIILSNLIRNAVNFRDEGEVTVTASQHGDGVTFRVSDTGIGMTHSTLSSLFEPFNKGEMPPTHAGIGLGLYIVQRLLELLAGSISVDSQVGQGSTFHVWIPRRVMKE